MLHRALNELPDESVSHNADILKRVLLRNGDVPNVTQFARAVFAAGQVAAVHVHHDMAEVFFVEQGRGTIVVDGNATALSEGHCVAILPGEQHEIRNDSRDDLVMIYFGVRVQP